MHTLLYQRLLGHEWRPVPYVPGNQRYYNPKLHLVVIESIDDVPELGKQHHISISYQGAEKRRPTDDERDLVARIFMDVRRPIEEEPAARIPYVRHLWQGGK